MVKQARLVTPDDVAMVRALATWSTTCRDLLGLSQDDVGKQAGRSQGAISRVESGHCYATPLVTYRAVARVYGRLGDETRTPLPSVDGLLGAPTLMTVDVDPLRQALLHAFDSCPPSRRLGLVDCVQRLVALTQPMPLRVHDPACMLDGDCTCPAGAP